MAAQVEVQSAEVGRTGAGGRLHLSPLTDSSNKSHIEIPSVHQAHVIASEPNKPVPGPKPRISPKPFAVDKNPTIKPILAPKPQTKPRPESTRLAGYKPELPCSLKPEQPAATVKVSSNPNRPASTSFKTCSKLNSGQTTKPVAQPFKPAPPFDPGDPSKPIPPVPTQRQRHVASSLGYSKSLKKPPAAEWSGTTKKEDEKDKITSSKGGASITRAKSMGFLAQVGQEEEEMEKAEPEIAVPLRPKPRSSRPRPVSAILLDSPSKTEAPVPAPRWGGRRPLSADLTSKFESIGLSLHRKSPMSDTKENTPEETALAERRVQEKPSKSTATQCTDVLAKPDISDQSNKKLQSKEEITLIDTEQNKQGGSIKSRISLLLDSTSMPGSGATGQGSDLHSPVQPIPENEPPVGVKQLIKQLTEDTSPAQSPVTKPAPKPRPLPLDLTKRFSSEGSPDLGSVSISEATDHQEISKALQRRNEELTPKSSDQGVFMNLKDSQEQFQKASAPEVNETGKDTFSATLKERAPSLDVQTVRASVFENVVERHNVMMVDEATPVNKPKDSISHLSFHRRNRENEGSLVTATFKEPISPPSPLRVVHAFDSVQAIEENRAISESVPSAQWEDKAMTLRSRRSEGSKPSTEKPSSVQPEPSLAVTTEQQPRYLRVGALPKWSIAGHDQEAGMEKGMLKEPKREGEAAVEQHRHRKVQEDMAIAPEHLKMLHPEEPQKPRATYFALTGQMQEPVSPVDAGAKAGNMAVTFDDFSVRSALGGSQGKILPFRRNPSLDEAFGKTTQDQVLELMMSNHMSHRDIRPDNRDVQTKEEVTIAGAEKEFTKESEKHRAKLKELEKEKLGQLEIEKQAHLEFARKKDLQMQRELEKQRQKAIEKEKKEFEKKQRALELQKQIELEKQKFQELEKDRLRQLERERLLELQKEKQKKEELERQQKQKERERQQLIELEKQRRREMEREEAEKLKQMAMEQETLRLQELAKEMERQRELENEHRKEMEREKQRQVEREKQRELQKEMEREKQRQLEREKQREMQREMEREKQREMEREKQREMQREMEREKQREMEREKQREIQREIEREKQREVEREKQRVMEREKQREVEREKQREVEREKQRVMEREKQREMEREKQREMEREKQRMMEREKQREMEREKQRMMEKEKQREVEREKQRVMERQRQLDLERQDLENQRSRQLELEREKQKELERLKDMERRQLLEFERQKQAQRDRQQVLEEMEREEAEKMRQIAKQQEAERQRIKEKQKKEQERTKLESSDLRPKVLDLDSVLRNEPISKATSQRSDPATRWKEPSARLEESYKPAILDIDAFTSQTQLSPSKDLFPVCGIQGGDAGFGAKLQPTPERDYSWKVPPQTSVGFSNSVWMTSPQDPWELQPVEMSVDKPVVEPRKYSNLSGPEQLLRQEEQVLAPQRHWSSLLDEPLYLAPGTGTDARADNPAAGGNIPAEQVWVPRELQPQISRVESRSHRRTQGSQELNRMRSRSVSRRSAPSSSAVEGSLSRMRSRSAHREQDRHSWVQQKQSVSGEEEGNSSETPVRETDSQYGTWETGLRTDDSLTPATPSTDSNLTPSPRKPTPPYSTGDHTSQFETDTLDGLLPSSSDSPPLSFPDAPTTLLDTSVLRSRAQLGKKRAPRTRPSRAARQSATLAEGEEGSTEDWLFRDSTEGKDGSKEDDSDFEEQARGADAPPAAAASQPQRVALFPGVDPSALKAQLKKRGDCDNQTDGPAPSPSHLSRSPKSPFLPQAARVLPLPGGKDTGEENSPQWLKELKSKKRLSQYDTES